VELLRIIIGFTAFNKNMNGFMALNGKLMDYKWFFGF
jgi:hypothetical protein